MEMTLTKNFWTCVRTLLFGTDYNHPIGYVYSSSNGGYNAFSMNTIGDFKDINGTTRTLVSADNSNYELYALQLFSFGGSLGSIFEVGSGTTTATENDYVVESPIANATVTVTGQQSVNGFVTFHLVVTATADISLSEICMLKKLKTRTTGGENYTVLLGRCVLETPVALANGENKTFDVTISLPMPS